MHSAIESRDLHVELVWLWAPYVSPQGLCVVSSPVKHLRMHAYGPSPYIVSLLAPS